MSIRCHTAGDDMDMIVRRVTMSIDQKRLPLLRITHLLEVAVSDVKQLLIRVFISLAADCHMELGILYSSVTGRVQLEILTKIVSSLSFLPESNVRSLYQRSLTFLDLFLIIGDGMESSG